MPWYSITKLVFKEIYRKKDFYVALILIGVILLYASQIKFYNIENISRYIREIGITLIHLFSVLLAIPLAARQIPSEMQQRTLSVLLSKPVSRFQFVVGKFLGSYLASLSCFTFFYLTFVALVFFGSDQTNWIVVVQAGYLFALELLIIVAIAHCFSYFMTFGANFTLTAVIYFAMSIYGHKLDAILQNSHPITAKLGSVFCHLLPHIEFFDIRGRLIHAGDALPIQLVFFLSIYAVLYSSAMILLGWASFKKKFL